MNIFERFKKPLKRAFPFFLDKEDFLLYAFILFVSLPPLNLGVSIYFISKLLLLVIFIIVLLKKMICGTSLIGKKSKNFNILSSTIIFFLIPATISIVNSVNLFAFMSTYQNIIFANIFLYVIFQNEKLSKKNEIEKFLYIFIFVAFINAVAEFFIYYDPSIYPGLFKNILIPGTVNAIYYYLDQGKGTYESFLQLLIPLLLYFLFNKEGKFQTKIFLFGYLLLIIITSAISNLRIFFLMSVFALVGTLISYGKLLINRFSLKKVITIFLLMMSIIGVVFLISAKKNYNIFDRLLLNDSLDVSTINFRLDQWGKAIEIGKAYPVTGVGLGNFPEYADSGDVRNAWMDVIARKGNPPSYYYPHNLFFNTLAETGFTGLIGIMIIIISFIKSDLKVLFSENSLTKSLIISFWTIMLFSMFDPTSTFQFWIYFFLFRALIYKRNNLDTIH